MKCWICQKEKLFFSEYKRKQKKFKTLKDDVSDKLLKLK
jgi:hypothetical protein